MGKSALFLKAAAISSSISSVATTVSPSTTTINQNVNNAAITTPIEYPPSFHRSTSCRIELSNSQCDASTVERMLPIRGGFGNKDDTSSATSETSRKQQRHAASKESNDTTKPSKSAPKTKKTAKSSSSRIVNEIIKETDYYKILGLVREDVLQQNNNIDSTIQKAYRKRALQTHPDKTGGDRRAFDKVAEAYDVLQDANKRNIYNKYGKRGLEGGMGSGMGSAAGGMNGMAPEDLFRSFFGGPGAGTSPFGQSQQTRNRSMRFQVDVTLEDIYMGKTMKVVLPGSQTPIDLSIPRGSYHNENIIASGVIDNDSQQPPGDAHFRIKVRPHTTFTNKGYDLAVQIEISLAEAMTGVSRTIRHLDGRKVRVVSAAANHQSHSDLSAVGPIVIATGDVHILPGEGMPKNAMGTEFGDLYIQYQVTMPKNRGTAKKDQTSVLTEAERNELERLLNKLEGKSKIGDKAKVHWPFKSYKDGKILKKASVADFGKNGPTMNQNDLDHDSPFGAFGDGFTPGQRGFFWSASSSSSGTNSHPFGQDLPSDEDATQCRQM